MQSLIFDSFLCSFQGKLNLLRQEILSVFPESDILTPGDVKNQGDCPGCATISSFSSMGKRLMFVTRQDFLFSANDILFRRRCATICNLCRLLRQIAISSDLKYWFCAPVVQQCMAGPKNQSTITWSSINVNQQWMELLCECRLVSSHMDCWIVSSDWQVMGENMLCP